MADWIGGNFYLTREQMEMNATYCYGWLNANGWSLNAISGMFGNMQTESGINPGIWEDLNEGNLNEDLVLRNGPLHLNIWIGRMNEGWIIPKWIVT